MKTFVSTFTITSPFREPAAAGKRFVGAAGEWLATKGWKRVALLVFLLASGYYVYPQSAAPVRAKPPRLRLEVGKTYCFEYGYRWKAPWSVSGQDRSYPNEERIWYRLRVLGSQQDTLYRCSVQISRLFHYGQNSYGYDVFDSRYPTPLNTGDAHLLAEGFTYTGTINTQGRFLPDAGSLRRIDSLVDRMVVLRSSDYRSCSDSCFREKAKDFLYRNLGILQLFYPAHRAAKWQPPAFALDLRPTSDHLARISDAYMDVKELEFIPRGGAYSLVRLTYDRPRWQGGIGGDTLFIHNQNGFVAGRMTTSRAMGWERSVSLSFYPQAEEPAVLQLEFAGRFSLSSYSRRRLKQYGIYKAADSGKVLLRIPLDRPALFNLPERNKPLYLTPGDTLFVKVLADTSLEFAGIRARENRLLQQFLQQSGEAEKARFGSRDWELAERKDPDVYAAELHREMTRQRQLLNSMKSELGPALFTLLYERIPYVQAGRYANFLWPYYRMNSSQLQTPKQRFMDFIDDIPLYNADLMFSGYGHSHYDNFLREYQAFLRIYNQNDRDMASVGGSGTSDIYEMNFVASHFGGYPYYYLTARVLKSIAGSLEGRLNNFAPLFDEFLASCTDSVLETPMASLYRAKQALQPGNKFPEVRFADRDGEPVSISDLHGHKVLLYLITETDVQKANMPGQKQAAVLVMDSLNSLRKQWKDIELVFLYVGADGDEWKAVREQGPDDVHLWHTPPENTATSDFVFSLRNAKELYKKTWFLIDEKQAIFKTGVINSVLQRDSETWHARQVREFFERELQLFSLHRAAFLDPHLKRWGFLVLGILIPAALISWLLARWRIKVVRKREEEKRRVTEIELRAIRAQLNPHFIFNTMSSIQHLVSSGESEKASGYLSDLAVLMRMVLKHTEKGMISLAEELEAITKYLSLEQLRFSFRYQITAGTSVDRHTTLVPAMLLQPYVENAVLHGMSGRGSDGFLQINAAQSGSWMTYSVEDNGPGMRRAESSRNGNQMSLKLMQEKLRLVYGEDMRLEIMDLADLQEGSRGTRVVIHLPAFV